jgi:hypothetical protein
MRVWSFFWDDPGESHCNVQHIAEHDLTVEDVEHVFENTSDQGTSKSTGLPAVWGHTSDGRFIERAPRQRRSEPETNGCGA